MMADADKAVVISRREARLAAMHIIFAALSNAAAARDSIDGVRALLAAGRRQDALSDELAERIINAFDNRRHDIEQWMVAAYGHPLLRMTMVERAIITAATAEMLATPDTPRPVIINEAIELAKQFGGEGGDALVNGVLDAIAKQQ